MSQIKNQLSKEFRIKRSHFNFQLRERESEATVSRLCKLPEWITASHVCLYLSVSEELDTLPLVQQILKQHDKKLYVPYIAQKETGIEITSLSEFSALAPGTFGILEPRPAYRDPVDPGVIDLICVPGIVFDRRGGRIGYGHGYYDRFLKKTHATKIGLAFEFQVLSEIPQSPLDVPMDIIVTASEEIRCHG